MAYFEEVAEALLADVAALREQKQAEPWDELDPNGSRYGGPSADPALVQRLALTRRRRS